MKAEAKKFDVIGLVILVVTMLSCECNHRTDVSFWFSFTVNSSFNCCVYILI